MLLLILFLQKLLAVLIHATQKPKPKVAFSIFHFILLYPFSPGLCRHRPAGHSLGTK